MDDSDGSYVQSPSNVDQMGLPIHNSSFTIEAWIKPEHMDGDNTITSWGHDQTRRENHFKLNGTSLGHRFHNYDFYVEVGDLTDQWHHVAVVYESQSERRFYLDGQMVGSQATEDVNVRGDERLHIGHRRPGGHETFAGMIDQVRISNLAIYDGDFTPDLTLDVQGHTAGLWYFDDNSYGDAAHGHGRTDR